MGFQRIGVVTTIPAAGVAPGTGTAAQALKVDLGQVLEITGANPGGAGRVSFAMVPPRRTAAAGLRQHAECGGRVAEAARGRADGLRRRRHVQRSLRCGPRQHGYWLLLAVSGDGTPTLTADAQGVYFRATDAPVRGGQLLRYGGAVLCSAVSTGPAVAAGPHPLQPIAVPMQTVGTTTNKVVDVSGIAHGTHSLVLRCESPGQLNQSAVATNPGPLPTFRISLGRRDLRDRFGSAQTTIPPISAMRRPGCSWGFVAVPALAPSRPATPGPRPPHHRRT